ncbi:MAG: hypothetical protein ABIT47_03730 [Candidatus Paceibacterota bacterium]
MHRFLLLASIAIASASLSACDSSDKLVPITKLGFETALDESLADMTNLPIAQKIIHKPAFSNGHRWAMTFALHNGEGIKRATYLTLTRGEHGGPVTVFMGHVGTSVASSMTIVDGACTEVRYKGHCSWLTMDEWHQVNATAIDFANKHGGKF